MAEPIKIRVKTPRVEVYIETALHNTVNSTVVLEIIKGAINEAVEADLKIKGE